MELRQTLEEYLLFASFVSFPFRFRMFLPSNESRQLLQYLIQNQLTMVPYAHAVVWDEEELVEEVDHSCYRELFKDDNF